MKRFICLVLSLLMCLSISSVAFAEAIRPAEQLSLSSESSDSSTRAEETIWYFRYVNGRTQMRLWSLTYGKWLTEWIDIGPAP